MSIAKIGTGKVRDIFRIKVADGQELVAFITSDRISAFDHIFEQELVGKGAILAEVSQFFAEDTASIVPNYLIPRDKISQVMPQLPHNVVIGHYAEPFKAEFIVRQYLTGSLWRAYEKGERKICGITLPDGLQQYQKFPELLFTPTTKDVLHDENISEAELIERGIIYTLDLAQVKKYCIDLFVRGAKLAEQRGLVLVDTKFEFGNHPTLGVIAIDEILTPDSSRYWIASDNPFTVQNPPVEKSKEVLRKWLLEQGYDNQLGQTPPVLSTEVLRAMYSEYVDLYQLFVGKSFTPDGSNFDDAEFLLYKYEEQGVFTRLFD